MPELERDRIEQIFRFLLAFHQHRNPVTRQIKEQRWHKWLGDLPPHADISLHIDRPVPTDDDSTDEDFILRIRRPVLTSPPAAPSVLEDWLASYADPSKNPEPIPTRNLEQRGAPPQSVSFESSQERVNAFGQWRLQWDTWANIERPNRLVMQEFERLYALYGDIEREGEKVELVFGDGVLTWRLPDGGIAHPLLLQRAELVFDPSVPEFRVIETDAVAELYTPLLQTLAVLEGGALNNFQTELRTGGFNPLYANGVNGFYQRIASTLSSRGAYSESLPVGETEDPVISKSPVLFLRTRNLGFPAAIEAILDDIAQGAQLPSSLVSVVGVERDLGAVDEEPSARDPITGDPEDVLLSKPANREQVRIAEQLKQHGSVLVQGPPGTGKSHTIANLIGHLLARGKTVLVTSHTTKALNVLRNHVVEELRPLCVSVLDKDTESRQQLESSAAAIVDRLSRTDYEQLAEAAERAADKRSRVFSELSELRLKLRDAIGDEYRPILYGGVQLLPTEAAKEMRLGADEHSWIPSPVTLGAELPLSNTELSDLYTTNSLVSELDESDLSSVLPPLEEIPTPTDFEKTLEHEAKNSELDASFGATSWGTPPSVDGAERLGELERLALDLVNPLRDESSWEIAVISAGRSAGVADIPWRSLISEIQDLVAASAAAEDDNYRYGPILPNALALDVQSKIVEELATAALQKPIGRWALFRHPDWKMFLASSRINGVVPVTVKEFSVLAQQLRVALARQRLGLRWDRQMAAAGAPAFSDLGQKPEGPLSQFAARIDELLAWTDNSWNPLKAELESMHLNVNGLLNAEAISLGSAPDLIRIRDLCTGTLRKVLAARIVGIWRTRVEMVLRGWAQLFHESQPWGNSPVVSRLNEALSARDEERYLAAYNRLTSLLQKQLHLKRRQELLVRLEACAPAWAAKIRRRSGAFGAEAPPENHGAAWRWRQIADELDARGKTSIPTLQHAIDRESEQLRKLTTDVIDKFAWAAQLRRTNLSTRQALIGWVDLMRRIGAGTGRRVPQLRAAARATMESCRGAVPVWIMPLSRVAESFRPTAGLFDVVIIDEASQSDVMGLLAFYLGKNVVVVGDHEQVSPTAVGQNLNIISGLIATHLQGIPNSTLYDGKMSVYDLARAAFGGTICLVEHFRCVPDIIAFSNALSYEGRIKPLRDSQSGAISPHVTEYCVAGAHSDDKTNSKEAIAVCALIKAVIAQPEYAGLSIGVISLVGEEQALLVERLLRREIDVSEYDARRIVCGNAAQFQGDERDVMFLSVVDAPAGGPLRRRSDAMFKQRFNVATSRARDQMWVVHSLDPATDLQPGDLRRDLIEHVRNPAARANAITEGTRTAESPFESRVIECLIRRGFLVRSQVRVGFYRIDIVVEGSSGKLAIECDGERWHTQDNLAEDLGRQAVLERLGWQFVRIRGSLFFRDAEAALAPVYARLEELGILPVGLEPQSDTSAEPELRRKVVMAAESFLRTWDNERADNES